MKKPAAGAKPGTRISNCILIDGNGFLEMNSMAFIMYVFRYVCTYIVDL